MTNWCLVVGWLEPLLDRIAINRTIVVCPVIDVIEDDSFKYQYGSAKATSIGGFDWNMQFTWHSIPDYEKNRRAKDILPVRYRVSPKTRPFQTAIQQYTLVDLQFYTVYYLDCLTQHLFRILLPEEYQYIHDVPVSPVNKM